MYNNININIVIDYYESEEDMADVNALIKQAIKETEKLKEGECFLLRDLFKGYEWNRISKKDRLLLGTLFLNKINTEDFEIKAFEKSSSGQQKYQIIRRGIYA